MQENPVFALCFQCVTLNCKCCFALNAVLADALCRFTGHRWKLRVTGAKLRVTWAIGHRKHIQHHVIGYRTIMSHSSMSHHTAPCYTMHHAAPHRTAPHRAAPHHTAPHRTAPHCSTKDWSIRVSCPIAHPSCFEHPFHTRFLPMFHTPCFISVSYPFHTVHPWAAVSYPLFLHWAMYMYTHIRPFWLTPLWLNLFRRPPGNREGANHKDPIPPSCRRSEAATVRKIW